MANQIMLYVFWVLFFLIFYHYFIFPLIVVGRSVVCRKTIDIGISRQRVSLIIAAYNEEKVIRQKIKNSFELDYPKDLLEIIVVSDGSTDSTPKIVEEYVTHGVKGLFSPPRKGKTAALNHAVEHATGEIIVFSDANSMYKKDAITKLTRNFHDSSIGGVCGRKSIVENIERESSRGDSLFWDFESFLKTRQSRGGSISNGDGEIFALRRELYEEIPEEIINDDQIITINIIKNGYRVVYESEAVSFEEASIVIEDDFKVKARMVTGGYQTIAYYKYFFFPPADYYKFQFFSHKVLRYIMPFLLIFLFINTAFLFEGYFVCFFVLQSIFYSTAIMGKLIRKLNFNPGPFYIPYYYCTMNIAAIWGLYYFFAKKSGVSVWKKAQR